MVGRIVTQEAAFRECRRTTAFWRTGAGADRSLARCKSGLAIRCFAKVRRIALHQRAPSGSICSGAVDRRLGDGHVRSSGLHSQSVQRRESIRWRAAMLPARRIAICIGWRLEPSGTFRALPGCSAQGSSAAHWVAHAASAALTVTLSLADSPPSGSVGATTGSSR